MENLKKAVKEYWENFYADRIETATDGRKKRGIITRMNNQIKKDCEKIEAICSADDKIRGGEMVITVLWKKSSIWGRNPTAKDNFGNSSGSISGCVYDRYSTQGV